MTEDPRAKEKGICGVTFIGSTGIEWICVKKVHAKVYTRNTSGYGYRKGDPIFSSSRTADSHYFVNRWPNREK